MTTQSIFKKTMTVATIILMSILSALIITTPLNVTAAPIKADKNVEVKAVATAPVVSPIMIAVTDKETPPSPDVSLADDANASYTFARETMKDGTVRAIKFKDAANYDVNNSPGKETIAIKTSGFKKFDKSINTCNTSLGDNNKNYSRIANNDDTTDTSSGQKGGAINESGSNNTIDEIAVAIVPLQ